MQKIINFEHYAPVYDNWIESSPSVFNAELKIFKALVPRQGFGLDVGVGTGRMAQALGIQYGVDASAAMCRLARQRGINVSQGYAEALPFRNNYFDYYFTTETLCLINKPIDALREAERVLKAKGKLILGVVNWNQALSWHYITERNMSRFYRLAHFLSLDETIHLLHQAGLKLDAINPIAISPNPSFGLRRRAPELTPSTADFYAILASKP